MPSNDYLTAYECIRCETFSTNGVLSIAEQQEQMKRHLDVAHPYWDLENIEAGPHAYRTNFRQKVRQKCEADARHVLVTGPQLNSLDKTSQRKQWLGIIGSILLFIGVFTPIINLPIVGSINYFNNGRGDGVIVLVLAVIAIALTFGEKYGALWITGTLALAVILFTFINFQVRLSEMQDEMETKLAGNPFRGIADVAMQSIQLQWGWAVLIVGVGFLIAASIVSDKR